jgi:hypothetical protein
MRPAIGCIYTILAVTIPLNASSAQDAIVCEALRASPPGLYVVYPTSAGAPNPIRNGPIKYDPDARFYFVHASKRSEGVWHVRTQTTARAARDADEAIVYRAALQTSCRPTPFEAFDKDSRYVSLNAYIDHHAPPAESPREHAGIARNFHFEAPAHDEPGCFRTDDRRVLGPNLLKVYGFEGVVRRGSRVARAARVGGEAVAATSERLQELRRFAGLSSELTYSSGSGSACFSFSAPLPTSSSLRSQLLSWYRDTDARRAAQDWGPLTTEIVVKQVRGRNIAEITRRVVTWKF